MPGLFCSTPHQRLAILQRCPHLGIYRRKRGKTTKLLFLFLFLFLCFWYISCIFFCFCVWGHKFSFVGALMDFLRLYPMPILFFGLLGTANVTSWLGVMSTSGRLSRWFMNLVGLLVELDFNSQSSEGCFGLRSPTLHCLVLPLIWVSTTADQGDVSLTHL